MLIHHLPREITILIYTKQSWCCINSCFFLFAQYRWNPSRYSRKNLFAIWLDVCLARFSFEVGVMTRVCKAMYSWNWWRRWIRIAITGSWITEIRREPFLWRERVERPWRTVCTCWLGWSGLRLGTWSTIATRRSAGERTERATISPFLLPFPLFPPLGKRRYCSVAEWNVDFCRVPLQHERLHVRLQLRALGLEALGAWDWLDGAERHQHASRLQRVAFQSHYYLQTGVSLLPGVQEAGSEWPRHSQSLHGSRVPALEPYGQHQGMGWSDHADVSVEGSSAQQEGGRWYWFWP